MINKDNDQEIDLQVVDLKAIKELLNNYEKEIKISYGGAGGKIHERMKHIIDHHRVTASQALVQVKQLQDDFISYLRALVLLYESTLCGGTHHEKDARLRGMVQLAESAINALRERQINFAFAAFYHPDVFRSDYPTRHFVERIHELEDKLKEKDNTSNDN